jgi:hypothetical protein
MSLRLMRTLLPAAGEQQEIDIDHFQRTADLTMGELLMKVDAFLKEQGADKSAGMRVDLTEGAAQT